MQCNSIIDHTTTKAYKINLCGFSSQNFPLSIDTYHTLLRQVFHCSFHHFIPATREKKHKRHKHWDQHAHFLYIHFYSVGLWTFTFCAHYCAKVTVRCSSTALWIKACTMQTVKFSFRILLFILDVGCTCCMNAMLFKRIALSPSL